MDLDIVALANSMDWELGPVRRALQHLQRDPELGTGVYSPSPIPGNRNYCLSPCLWQLFDAS